MHKFLPIIRVLADGNKQIPLRNIHLLASMTGASTYTRIQTHAETRAFNTLFTRRGARGRGGTFVSGAPPLPHTSRPISERLVIRDAHVASGRCKRWHRSLRAVDRELIQGSRSGLRSREYLTAIGAGD
jgi:hypothetical protein